MILPHGGSLVDLYREGLPAGDNQLIASHNIQIDIHNLASGAYSPLTGFMRSHELESVLTSMKLPSGETWSVPIIAGAKDADQKGNVEILTPEKEHIATLVNVEIYPFDKSRYCERVFGTSDTRHPGVQRTMAMPDMLIGGDLVVKKGWKVPFGAVGENSILTPQEMRDHFEQNGWNTVVAFQTRNVPHRGHEYIQKCALENVDALLVHPVIGEKKSGDWRDEIILGSYQVLAQKYYNPDRVIISCLPWVMCYAGPREAIMHAIIRQNFGCSHFIVGRDHAGVGDFYGPYDAQKIFDSLSPHDLAIQTLRYENAAYCPQVQGVVTDKTSPSPSAERVFISGTKFRQMLTEGECPPQTFIRKEIADYLLSQNGLFVE